MLGLLKIKNNVLSSKYSSLYLFSIQMFVSESCVTDKGLMGSLHFSSIRMESR